MTGIEYCTVEIECVARAQSSSCLVFERTSLLSLSYLISSHRIISWNHSICCACALGQKQRQRERQRLRDEAQPRKATLEQHDVPKNKHISLVVIYRFINLDKENLRKARSRLRLAARPPGRTKAD